MAFPMQNWPVNTVGPTWESTETPEGRNRGFQISYFSMDFNLVGIQDWREIQITDGTSENFMNQSSQLGNGIQSGLRGLSGEENNYGNCDFGRNTIRDYPNSSETYAKPFPEF